MLGERLSDPPTHHPSTKCPALQPSFNALHCLPHLNVQWPKVQAEAHRSATVKKELVKAWMARAGTGGAGGMSADVLRAHPSRSLILVGGVPASGSNLASLKNQKRVLENQECHILKYFIHDYFFPEMVGIPGGRVTVVGNYTVS